MVMVYPSFNPVLIKKPINVSNAAFNAVNASLFATSSPINAPINGPIIIPIMGSIILPIIKPIIEPITPCLEPPNLLTIHEGST